jgi:hypothetical protein
MRNYAQTVIKTRRCISWRLVLHIPWSAVKETAAKTGWDETKHTLEAS